MAKKNKGGRLPSNIEQSVLFYRTKFIKKLSTNGIERKIIARVLNVNISQINRVLSRINK